LFPALLTPVAQQPNLGSVDIHRFSTSKPLKRRFRHNRLTSFNFSRNANDSLHPPLAVSEPLKFARCVKYVGRKGAQNQSKSASEETANGKSSTPPPIQPQA
jgi:hypothetical protein